MENNLFRIQKLRLAILKQFLIKNKAYSKLIKNYYSNSKFEKIFDNPIEYFKSGEFLEYTLLNIFIWESTIEGEDIWDYLSDELIELANKLNINNSKYII